MAALQSARQRREDLNWEQRFAALQLLADPNCPQDHKTPGDGTEGSAFAPGKWLDRQLPILTILHEALKCEAKCTLCHVP